MAERQTAWGSLCEGIAQGLGWSVGVFTLVWLARWVLPVEYLSAVITAAQRAVCGAP